MAPSIVLLVLAAGRAEADARLRHLYFSEVER
jgi:hypothetical protein